MKQCVRCGVHIKEETNRLWCKRCMERVNLFDGKLNGYKQRGCNMVELVSKSSGLWQFVCENKLFAKGILDLPDVLWKRDSLACMRTDLRKSCYPHDYEYRLIESSLEDEDRLEDFILDNIKVGNED